MESETSLATLKETAIGETVVAAIKDLNDQLPDDQKIDANGNTPLFGEGASLDSLGLVNLIVSVEERLLDDLDMDVLLANEKAMSRRHSPFRTIRSLIEYVTELANEEAS